MQVHTQIVVKEGFFVKQVVTEQVLGPHSEILKKKQTEAISIIPDAFRISIPSRADYEKNTYEEPLKLPAHYGCSGNLLYIAHRVVYWPLYSHFDIIPDVDATGIANPDKQFLHYNGRRTKNLRVGIEYPGLWMVYAFRILNSRINKLANVYLVTNIKKQFYAPLLPNIFDNGKICLGHISATFEGSVQETVQKLFNEIHMSASNTHLMGEKHWEVLKFTKEKKDDKFIITWNPPTEFMEQPGRYHSGRILSIAADFLTQLAVIEETE